MKLKAMILLVATCFTANLVAGDGEGRVYLGFSVTPDVTYRYFILQTCITAIITTLPIHLKPAIKKPTIT
jgi:hypothetical protein